LSRLSDREALSEVRANSFAACFLMPEEGVRSFLAEMGKGQPGRVRLEVFDGDGVVPVEGRVEAGSQKLQLHDIVLLADHFGVSRTSVLYRLRNLQLLTQAEMGALLADEQAGRGRSRARLLGLPEPDHEAARDEFRSRFLGLALEAFRREKISEGKLRELSNLVEASSGELDRFLDEAGSGDSSVDALLPGGLD
jgi:hypothetical protein